MLRGGGMHYFIRPQVDYLCDETGKMLVDRVYKLEEIRDAFADIQARAGVKSDLPHVNASSTKQAPAKQRAKVRRALRRGKIAQALHEYFGKNDMHEAWADYFRDEECRRRVEAYYKADFEMLGYATGV